MIEFLDSTAVRVILSLVGVFAMVSAVVAFVASRRRGDSGRFFGTFIAGAVLIGQGTLGVVTEFGHWITERLKDIAVETSPTTPTTTPANPTPTVEPSSEPFAITGEFFPVFMWVLLGVLFVLSAIFIPMIVSRESDHVRVTPPAQTHTVATAQTRAVTVWKDYQDRYVAVKRAITQADDDWETMFSMPALLDSSVDATYEVYLRMREVQNVEGDCPRGVSPSTVSTLAFPVAVVEFEKAWNKAVANARRVGQSFLTSDERKSIAEIRALLSKVTDGASTDAERALAYSRISKLTERLSISVPQNLMQELETLSRPAITV